MMKSEHRPGTDNWFQILLTQHLSSANPSSNNPLSDHLDDDLLAAFTTGSLARRELRPVVEHLASCNFCRQTTAELVRLDSQIEYVAPLVEATPTEPSVISRLLESVLSGWRGLGDQAVFAHSEEEPEKDPEKEETPE